MGIQRESDVYEARFQARQMARAMGFDPYDEAAIETAVSELATNIVRHAGRGVVVISSKPPGRQPKALEVMARNASADPDVPAQKHPMPREGLGIGLEGCSRLMDQVKVEYVDGCLQVTALKWLPAFRPPPSWGSFGVVDSSARFHVQAAARPWQPGVCADSYIVKEQQGQLLVLVADVLGHGDEAARVAERLREVALQVLGRALPVRPGGLWQELRDALRYTRGACVTVVTVAADGRRVEWIGAGSVRARVWHAGAPGGLALLVPPGIVGYNEAHAVLRAAEVLPPACLAVITDGVDEAALFQEPGDAESLLRRFASPRDDATAVVVRWTR